jgi:hypothetical protein
MFTCTARKGLLIYISIITLFLFNIAQCVWKGRPDTSGESRPWNSDRLGRLGKQNRVLWDEEWLGGASKVCLPICLRVCRYRNVAYWPCQSFTIGQYQKVDPHQRPAGLVEGPRLPRFPPYFSEKCVWLTFSVSHIASRSDWHTINTWN